MLATRKLKAARTAFLAAAAVIITLTTATDGWAQRYRGSRMPGMETGPGRMPGGMRPDYNRPRPDYGRPRPGYGRPGWGGVATGIGIGVATGIILGTAAHANRPPPPYEFYDDPPPRRRKAPPPPRNATPPAPRSTAAIQMPPGGERRFVPDEVLMEFGATVPPQQIDALVRRHRLVRLDSQTFPLTNSTLLRARIPDRRSVPTVLRSIGQEAQLRAGQPNFVYAIQQAEPDAQASSAAATTVKPAVPEMPAVPSVVAPADATPSKGDPAQYALAKLRLGEAHGLARGKQVLVAVIDSGIETNHPEFRDSITETFDALDAPAKNHAHGTAMAGAIAARSRLMGVAPAASILAVRAFGSPDNKSDGTTFAIVRGLNHAVTKGARVINMSFAGPADAAFSRQLTAARGRGVVLIAAAGNAGAKAPPMYPAADPNVIAVTATDPDDRLFKASNQGRHIAIAAPGVDILAPAPDAAYQVTSGTSIAAAHVSGIAALILERKPGLSPDAVRDILVRSAKDLGPRGRDDQFGAGLADAYQAILVIEPQAAAAR